MTRIRRDSALRLTVTAAMLLGAPVIAPAGAEPAPDGIAALIADVADANQRLQDLGAQIQAEKESVNKAVSDLATARDNAAAAQGAVDASQHDLRDADASIAAAQQRFDDYAVASYISGPSDSYLTADSPEDILAGASVSQMLAASSQDAMAALQSARTERSNRESAARLSKQRADQALTDAQSSQDAAVAKLTETQGTFAQQRQQIDQLAAQRDQAQAKLAAARGDSGPAAAPQWEGRTEGAGGARRWDGEWDPSLPMVPSAFVSGDPVAVINTLLGYSQTSAQLTQDMGRKFMQSMGLLPTPTGYTNTPGAIPRVYGQQASEYVIRRAGAQIGVPYSWGGGNAAGPSKGIGSGSGTVGFDCSGLVLYGFAGVGIKLPHYSGSQYELGRKIPSAQMRRGDVIFYGPGGAQHVTIYLGNGQMLEAPDVGQTVKISPVRTSGMTPYVIRYIEY